MAHFWRVTFPLSMPGVIAGSILVFIPSAGEFVIPNLLGGARTVMVGNLIQQQFLQARDWAFGSALAVMLAVLLVGAIMFYVRRVGAEKLRGCRAMGRVKGGPVYRGLARSQTGSCSCSPASCTCSFYAPSWSWCSSRSTRPEHPGLDRLLDAVVRGASQGPVGPRRLPHLDDSRRDGHRHRHRHRHAHGAGARERFRGKTFADSTIYAATVMPEIVVGVSLLVFFVASAVELGITTIIIAHVAFTISFVTIVVRRPPLGDGPLRRGGGPGPRRNPVQTFLRVTLPLILPGVMAGALLAFTLSFDDFVITFFVSGVGSSTLPLKIYSMINSASPVINALDGGAGLDHDPDPGRQPHLVEKENA